MRETLRFTSGLALALMLSAATLSAVGITWITVKDAVQSGGSLESFEAAIRHYSDRIEVDDQGIRFIRARHPFLLHFGMLALCWVATVAIAAALRHLLRDRQPLPEKGS